MGTWRTKVVLLNARCAHSRPDAGRSESGQHDENLVELRCERQMCTSPNSMKNASPTKNANRAKKQNDAPSVNCVARGRGCARAENCEA